MDNSTEHVFEVEEVARDTPGWTHAARPDQRGRPGGAAKGWPGGAAKGWPGGAAKGWPGDLAVCSSRAAPW